MKLIGISGKKRCGKDTVADILIDIYKDTIKASFAAALKIEVARATGFDIKYMDSHKENFRLLYQGWGTDFRRKLFGENYWVNKLHETLQYIDSREEECGIGEHFTVITDVRFPNEYDYVKSHGGIMIRVVRHNEVTDLHPSECALDNHGFDHIIYNFGTEQQLREAVEKLNLEPKKEQQNGTTEHLHTTELPSFI
jgi:hypothetical protein